MKISKVLSLVLTLSISIIILLDYMIAIKTIKNISNNSPIIMIQEKDIDGKVAEENNTQTAKIETNNIYRGEVTSRSGKREPLKKEAEEVEKLEEKSDIIEEAQIDEPALEVEEEEKPTYEGVELEYSAIYDIASSRLTKSKGVTYYNGHKETYYSQRVLPGKGLKMLNNNGRHVADDGTIRDGDGYIAVACNYLSKGSEIMTSLGPGKVYDTGGMTGKWIDIYVNW